MPAMRSAVASSLLAKPVGVACLNSVLAKRSFSPPLLYAILVPGRSRSASDLKRFLSALRIIISLP